MKLVLLTLYFSLLAIFTSAQENISRKSCPIRKFDVWELLANEGKYQEAIDTLHYFLKNTDTLNKHAEYWHLGQYYADINDYNSAVKYFRKSSRFFHRMADREWRLYFKGTIAFLKRDKKRLKRISERLWNNHSAYYEANAKTVQNLYNNFDKSYREAYKAIQK